MASITAVSLHIILTLLYFLHYMSDYFEWDNIDIISTWCCRKMVAASSRYHVDQYQRYHRKICRSELHNYYIILSFRAFNVVSFMGHVMFWSLNVVLHVYKHRVEGNFVSFF